MKSPKYNSIFISDVHLGSPGSQAKALLSFLKANPAKRLYLIGDIIDIWAMKRKVKWTPEYNDLVIWLFRQARLGVEIYYIPGNHDEAVRELIDASIDKIQIRRDMVVDGVLILHGDEADRVIQVHPNMAKVGAALYDFLISLNIQVNRLLAFFRLGRFSFSEYIKHKVKDAVKYINHFEQIIVNQAKSRGCHTVITGHIHTQADKMIDGVRYLNCGDWISHNTAVVEHLDGRLELLHSGS